MTMIEKTGLWCQEVPNNPISTKLRRNAAPIIAVFTATILLVSFFSYVSYVATHPVIQVIPEPTVPTKPGPNTSTSTGANATQKQPIFPVYQPPLPPDYPSITPTETEKQPMKLKPNVVTNEQGELVLQILDEGRVIAEFNYSTVLIVGIISGPTTTPELFIRFPNDNIIRFPANSP